MGFKLFFTPCPQVSLCLWRGTVVAVKSMMLPANGTERREKMAIMEAVISSALSHPNIVQVGGYYLCDCPCMTDLAALLSSVIKLLFPLIMQTYTSELRPVMDKSSMLTANMIDENVSDDINLELNRMDGSQDITPAIMNDPPLVSGEHSTVRGGLSSEAAVTPPSSDILGFELRLILEFCDCGNLRQALDLVRARQTRLPRHTWLCCHISL